MEYLKEITGSVANSFGSRAATSTINETVGEAQKVANGVLTTVGSTLERLNALGDTSLSDAQAAIAALGSFHPAAIAVNYSPPSYTNPGHTAPTSLSLTLNGALDLPTTGEVTVPFTPASPGVLGGTAPPSHPVAFGQAPTLQTIIAPVDPVKDSTSTPGDLTAVAPGEFVPTITPVAPKLRQLVLPTFTFQALPDYQAPTTQAPPKIPAAAALHIAFTPEKYIPTFLYDTAPDSGIVAIGQLFENRAVRASTLTYSDKGAALPIKAAQAQIAYSNEVNQLLALAEQRQLTVDQLTWELIVRREVLKNFSRADELMTNLALDYAKQMFDVGVENYERDLELIKMHTALYNAHCAAYAADLEQWKTEIEAQLAKLEWWKSDEQVEIAKTKFNQQLASIYAQEAQIETIGAEIYSAQVQGVLAQAQAYSARVQAVEALAEAAKTKVQTYKVKTEAYAAKQQAMKVEFDVYATQAKAVAAQNSAQQATTQLSVANMTQVGTMASFSAAQVETDAENLRATAAKYAASYEATKLLNTLEGIRAQTQGDAGRIAAMVFGAAQQRSESENEAVSAHAQQAVRYYTAASDAAYRASEQTLRALTSATQAAAVAQEAAGKTAAAIAQGAYSAVHVSAGLHGSGRVDGAEAKFGRFSNHFSDMLTYQEAREQVATA